MKINCPNCGKSHYVQHYSTTTALGWVQEYENGIPLNSNPNVSTTYCTCCECNHDFFYTEQYGEIQDIVDKGERHEVPVLKVPLTMPECTSETLPTDQLVYKPEPTNIWKTFVTTDDLKEINDKIDRLTKMVESLWERNTHDSFN